MAWDAERFVEELAIAAGRATVPASADGLDLAVVIEDEPSLGWRLRVTAGRAALCRDAPTESTLVLTLAAATAEELARGTLSPSVALASGSLRLSGALGTLADGGEAIVVLQAALAAARAGADGSGSER